MPRPEVAAQLCLCSQARVARRSRGHRSGVTPSLLILLTDLLTTDLDNCGCGWTRPSSASPGAGLSGNYGLIWTAETLLRIRRFVPLCVR